MTGPLYLISSVRSCSNKRPLKTNHPHPNRNRPHPNCQLVTKLESRVREATARADASATAAEAAGARAAAAEAAVASEVESRMAAVGGNRALWPGAAREEVERLEEKVGGSGLGGGVWCVFRGCSRVCCECKAPASSSVADAASNHGRLINLHPRIIFPFQVEALTGMLAVVRGELEAEARMYQVGWVGWLELVGYV
jgi:hypothetical protein